MVVVTDEQLVLVEKLHAAVKEVSLIAAEIRSQGIEVHIDQEYDDEQCKTGHLSILLQKKWSREMSTDTGHGG